MVMEMTLYSHQHIPSLFFHGHWVHSHGHYIYYTDFEIGIRIPLLIRLQTSLAVGLITLMGVMLNEDSMGTVSSVWTWGTLVTIGLLIGSSMIATSMAFNQKIGFFKP